MKQCSEEADQGSRWEPALDKAAGKGVAAQAGAVVEEALEVLEEAVASDAGVREGLVPAEWAAAVDLLGLPDRSLCR